MTFYRPCRNCAIEKSTCITRSAIRASVKGHGITSINFRCPSRTPMFRTGQRVSFPWSYWEVDDRGDSMENALIFTGTVLCEVRPKFVVRVDDVNGVAANESSEAMSPRSVFRNKDDLIVKVKAHEITCLGQEDVKICLGCGAYSGEESRCDGTDGSRSLGSYWPTECINKPSRDQ